MTRNAPVKSAIQGSSMNLSNAKIQAKALQKKGASVQRVHSWAESLINYLDFRTLEKGVKYCTTTDSMYPTGLCTQATYL